MLEYVLVLILIAIACVGGAASIGNITHLFLNVANTL